MQTIDPDAKRSGIRAKHAKPERYPTGDMMRRGLAPSFGRPRNPSRRRFKKMYQPVVKENKNPKPKTSSSTRCVAREAYWLPSYRHLKVSKVALFMMYECDYINADGDVASAPLVVRHGPCLQKSRMLYALLETMLSLPSRHSLQVAEPHLAPILQRLNHENDEALRPRTER